MEILVPCSAGHLIDQITILAIKNGRITNERKRKNVARELDALSRIRAQLPELNTPAVLRIEQALPDL